MNGTRTAAWMVSVEQPLLSVADKIARMNYDVHIGAILGLPGKLIRFLSSLTTASLPVMGFLVWWGRRGRGRGEYGRKNKAIEGRKEFNNATLGPDYPVGGQVTTGEASAKHIPQLAL